MSERVQWVNHQDREILEIDFSNLANQQSFPLVESLEKEIFNRFHSTHEKRMWVLLTIQNASFNYASADLGRLLKKRFAAAKIQLHLAIISPSRLISTLANTISKNVHFSKTRASALKWLYGQPLPSKK